MGTHGRHLPGIDGLRAIAVLAVVAYHAGLPIPAGFVGVDVFFVISGFLITRLLQDELQASDRIDILDFYARRARRILPALLVVIMATLAASFLLLPEAESRQAANAAAAAAVFGANIFFAAADTGYFDPATHTNPLLHLWSIGVEEQFYLLWPLIVLCSRRRLAVVIALVAGASFLLAELLLAADLTREAFYQTPPRAWGLAVGGLIAVVRPQVRAWAGAFGIVVTFAACFVPFRHFPGAGALLAVVGAAMVIAAASTGHRLPLLEARPLVVVGLASYSLYLWHWPIMVLGAELPAWLQLAASFAAAGASYRMIELPFRTRLAKPARPTVAAAGAGIACTCVAALAVATLRPEQPPAAADLLPIYQMGCDDVDRSATLQPCDFGDPAAERTAVLVGDSVVMQWFPAVRALYDREGWRLVVLTKSACPMIDAPYQYQGRLYTECEDWRASALEWIAQRSPDVVITGSANNYGFGQTQWTAGSQAVLERVSRAAKTVILLRATPMLTPGGHDAFDDAWRWEREAAAGLPNVLPVDMNRFVCPGGACARRADGQPRYRDARHLDPRFALALSPHLQQLLAERH